MKKLILLLSFLAATLSATAADRRIIFIAGKPSHTALAHEHRAGCLLLAKCLAGVPGIATEVYTNGWPSDESVLVGAAAIVVYSDGGAGHPLLQEDRLRKIDSLMKRGVGLACLHFAVEPTIEKGEKEFLDWIGGAFEINYSVNPHWEANFSFLPDHPITHGVRPFKTTDEWYFNMRFRDGLNGVIPILSAVPPDSTMSRPDGTHSGNPEVRKLVASHRQTPVAWAAVRADGGRGFGFCGGHNHLNWGDDDQRKLVLNAILWIANLEVPRAGVASTVSQEDLMANLDPKPQKPAAQPKKAEGK